MGSTELVHSRSSSHTQRPRWLRYHGTPDVSCQRVAMYTGAECIAWTIASSIRGKPFARLVDEFDRIQRLRKRRRAATGAALVLS